ncbi:MAG: helix-turn-helix domain-containing protein [Candidatus Thermochlorobacter sp.]
MQGLNTEEAEKELKKVSLIQAIGARLKEARLALNYSQQYFANRLNTSTGFISEIESGKKLPGVKLLHSLWGNFNLNSNWLLTGKGSMFDFNSSNSGHHFCKNQDTHSESALVQQQIATLIEENEKLRERILQLEAQVALPRI